MRWRVVLEYDGTDFVGWQRQPRGRSVQGAVEGALAQLLGHPVTVTASGRTDSGVHALGQVASFVAEVPRDAKAIRDGLNALLPTDVGCVSADEVPDTFDPRRHAVRKAYAYRFLERRGRSPLRRGRVWHVGRRLDVAAMSAAAEALVGEHDFASFQAAKSDVEHTVRRIEGAEVLREGDEVVFTVVGGGFLRHMVRIISGSLWDVGQGRRPPSWLAEVVASRDRTCAGRTAPPQGLTLLWVDYGE